MRRGYDSEFERLVDRARELLGAGDDAVLAEANAAINQALTLRPDSVEGWLVKCQVASATGDDISALAAAEMACTRHPTSAETLYWRGAVLGDLGRYREGVRAIEAALNAVTIDDHWLLEDLYYEKATILEALGLHEAAAAACQAGLHRCPGSALLRSLLAPTPSFERDRNVKPAAPSLRLLRGGRS